MFSEEKPRRVIIQFAATRWQMFGVFGIIVFMVFIAWASLAYP